MTKRFRRRVERGERGVALVEFALVFPVFMTLVLGMFSGGQAYDRKLTLTNAAREGSRYGATLAPGPLVPSPPPECSVAPPVSPPSSCGLDEWVTDVADAVEQNADGDLRDGVPGRTICVAYVHPTASTLAHKFHTHKVVRTTGPDLPAATECFADGLPSSVRRVQIEVSRTSPIQALFFDFDVTLKAQSVTRFEATDY